ncbi:hypothetical protein GMDG_00943 [Pseudogymnoascus destructans 20631-21]|uniref:Uncharacterized protein n=1 Tax=Pseudogymnoascus destructans (strain ATCC MYA-4855 / 20631-21) TaxID=658429 RepID=L8FMI5_PSED2|nr:hypothetical protein GMDG_00943 [Pseudogymnoascus destructans 20631-21]
MASLERRITRATSGGATPATEATEAAPGPTTQEIDDLVADQGGNMASKLADLWKQVEEERAYFNTMKEALEVFRGSHSDNYNTYPEALQDFARKQDQIQEESHRKRRQDIEDEWEDPRLEGRKEDTASTESRETAPAQRPIGRVKEPKVYKVEDGLRSPVLRRAPYEGVGPSVRQVEGYIDLLDITGFEEFLRDLHVDPAN